MWIYVCILLCTLCCLPVHCILCISKRSVSAMLKCIKTSFVTKHARCSGGQSAVTFVATLELSSPSASLKKESLMSGCSLQSETNVFGPRQQLGLVYVAYVLLCSCSGWFHVLWKIVHIGERTSYAKKGDNCTNNLWMLNHTGDRTAVQKKSFFWIQLFNLHKIF